MMTMMMMMMTGEEHEGRNQHPEGKKA